MSQLLKSLQQSRANAARALPAIKAVYDVGNWGRLVTLPLVDLGNNVANVASVVFSNQNAVAGTSKTRVSGGVSSTFQILNPNLALEPPFVQAATPNLTLVHNGNNTPYVQTFEWQPDFDCFLYGFNYYIGNIITITAFTSGAVNFTSVSVTVTTDLDGTNSQPLYSAVLTNIPSINVAALSKWNLMVIADTEFFNMSNTPKLGKIKAGQPVHIKLSHVIFTTGTNTYVEGWAPYWSIQGTAFGSGIAQYFSSQFSFLVKPAGDYSDPALVDSSMFGRFSR